MDYGRLAYEKLNELEKRILRVEEKSKSANVKEISFEENDDTQVLEYERSFQFEVQQLSTLLIKFSASFNQNVTANVKVLFDNVEMNVTNVDNSNSFVINMYQEALVGLKTLTIQVSALTEFCLNELNLKIQGAVIKNQREYSLSVVNSDSYSLIMKCDGKKTTIQKYDTNLPNQIPIFEVNAKKSAMVKFNNNILLCYIDENSHLKASIITIPAMGVLSTIDFGESFTSVAASNFTLNALIYGVRNAKVNRYYLTINGNRTDSLLTHRMVNSVYASTNTQNAYIVKSNDNNCKLILNGFVGNEVRLKLNKANNYRLDYINGEMYVRFSKNGNLFYRKVENNTLGDAVCDFVADDRVTLYDGKIIYRRNDKYIII